MRLRLLINNMPRNNTQNICPSPDAYRRQVHCQWLLRAAHPDRAVVHHIKSFTAVWLLGVRPLTCQSKQEWCCWCYQLTVRSVSGTSFPFSCSLESWKTVSYDCLPAKSGQGFKHLSNPPLKWQNDNKYMWSNPGIRNVHLYAAKELAVQISFSIFGHNQPEFRPQCLLLTTDTELALMNVV